MAPCCEQEAAAVGRVGPALARQHGSVLKLHHCKKEHDTIISCLEQSLFQNTLGRQEHGEHGNGGPVGSTPPSLLSVRPNFDSLVPFQPLVSNPVVENMKESVARPPAIGRQMKHKLVTQRPRFMFKTMQWFLVSPSHPDKDDGTFGFKITI